MNIKLRKIFNIFHRRTVIPTICILAILLAALIFQELSASSIDLKWRHYWCLLFLVPIYAALHCVHFPGELVIKGLSITFEDFRRKRLFTQDEYNEEPSEFSRRRHLRYRYDKVTIWVTSFEFRQNFIEKLFNVGHIYFIGKIRAREDIPKKVTIYGIPNFDTNKQEIERYFEQQKYESYFE